MKFHEFTAEQWLPVSADALFPFFADAGNLEEITPPWLRFEVITPRSLEMQVGALIDYRLRLHGLPLRWRSEITAWEPPRRFVDEQVRGPFRRWIHEHRLEARHDGTLVIDRVRYAVPGGALMNWIFVRRDVARIFSYRTAALGRRFAPSAPITPPAGNFQNSKHR
jgi:ligand-binding SRPBCC domain-containing protein